MSLALAGRFFTTSAAWEALYGYGFSAFFLSAWNPELPGAWLAWHASQIYVFIGNMGVKHYFLILKLVKSVYTCGLRLYIFHYFFFHSKWEKKKKNERKERTVSWSVFPFLICPPDKSVWSSCKKQCVQESTAVIEKSEWHLSWNSLSSWVISDKLGFLLPWPHTCTWSRKRWPRISVLKTITVHEWPHGWPLVESGES